MATLLPSLSSDEEKDLRDEESSDEEDNNEINNDFEFGGVLVCIRCDVMCFYVTCLLTSPLSVTGSGRRWWHSFQPFDGTTGMVISNGSG